MRKDNSCLLSKVGIFKMILVLSLLFLGLLDWHTWHSQPGIGMPVLVPDPKMRTLFVIASFTLHSACFKSPYLKVLV